MNKDISEDVREKMKHYVVKALKVLPQKEMVSRESYFSAPRIVKEARTMASVENLYYILAKGDKDCFSGSRFGGQDLVSLIQNEIESGEIETVKTIVPEMYRTAEGKRPIRQITGYRLAQEK